MLPICNPTLDGFQGLHGGSKILANSEPGSDSDEPSEDSARHKQKIVEALVSLSGTERCRVCGHRCHREVFGRGSESASLGSSGQGQGALWRLRTLKEEGLGLRRLK